MEIAGLLVTLGFGLEMLLAAVTVTLAATADGEDFGFSDAFEAEAPNSDTGVGLIFLGTLGGWTKLPSALSFFGLPNGFEPSLRILGFFVTSPFERVDTVGLGFGTRVVAGGCGGCDTTVLLFKT